MEPPIFSICSASSAVKNLLGKKPVRLYPFGFASQGVEKPYAVWQIISGGPQNLLGGLPNTDDYDVQVDAYATTHDSVLAVAKALRDALEPVAHITAWRGASRNKETLDYRYTFEVSFIHYRN